MPPMYGMPNFNFSPEDSSESSESLESSESFESSEEYKDGPTSLTGMAFWYMVALVVLLLVWLLAFFVLRIVAMRQKTRSPQQRRMYVGSRQRQSLTPQEPTIYVSPSNLPPPPKYELMAPPSYEEVVGIHAPNYQVQPISQPINVALAQSSSISQTEVTNATSNVASSMPTVTTINENAPSVTAEARRPSVTVSR